MRVVGAAPVACTQPDDSVSGQCTARAGLPRGDYTNRMRPASQDAEVVVVPAGGPASVGVLFCAL